MRSYSLPTALVALSSILVSSSVVAARTRSSTSTSSSRRRKLQLLDIIEANEEGGLLNLGWRYTANTDTQSSNFEEEVKETAPTTLKKVVQTTATNNNNRLRGAAIQDANRNAFWKKSEKKSKSKKGCKKKKGNYGKAGGKAGKKYGHGKSGPTNSLIAEGPSQAPSVAPTEEPSASLSPTEEWCVEDAVEDAVFGVEDEPTMSPSPTTTSAPTETPTVTSEPSKSPDPTCSHDPSVVPSTPVPITAPLVNSNLAPTPSPNSNLAPTPSPVGQSSSGQVNPMSYCELFPAAYETDSATGETDIIIWQAGTNEREQEGTAALASAVQTPLAVSDTDEYLVTVNMEIMLPATEDDIAKGDIDGDQDFDLDDVGTNLDVTVTPPVVLYILGCPNVALSMAEQYYYDNKNNRRRELQEEGVVESMSDMVVMKNWSCDYAISEEESCGANGICNIICVTRINYHGRLGFEEVVELIAWALGEYFSLMDDVTGWYPAQAITVKVEEVDTGNNNGVNGIETAIQEQEKSGMKAGPFIGAATGLLALLLLLVLCVRRRNRDDDQVSHLKFEDDDNTFYNGSDDNSAPNEYTSRDAHIIGEGDSVISHWTGYTGHNRVPSNYEVEYNKETTDVHHCSSATCEICAQKRQAGLNFVSTGANGEPNPMVTVRSRSLPSDASREYTAEDTVEL